MSFKQKLSSGFKQSVWFTGTTLAMAGVLYFTFPLWAAEMYFMNYFVHEMAHYFAGLATKGKPKLPFFIPLFFVVIGGTIVHPPNPKAGIITALAGPIAGVILNLGYLAYMLSISFGPGVFFSLLLLAAQVYSGTLGSDRRKFRRHLRELRYTQTNTTSETQLKPAFA